MNSLVRNFYWMGLGVGIFFLLTLNSCGKRVEQIPVYVDKTIEVPVEVIKEVNQPFEGIYYFANNSQLELVVDVQGLVEVRGSNQILISVNPDNQTLGEFPRIAQQGLLANGDIIFFTKNLKYDKNKHDIEKDEGGDIDGQKKTDVKIELLDDGRIRLTITVYANKINSNINYVVVTRVFESL